MLTGYFIKSSIPSTFLHGDGCIGLFRDLLPKGR